MLAGTSTGRIEEEFEKLEVYENPCGVCGKKDPEKPMCFRKTDWCCDLHRKVIQGELTLEA